MRGSKQIGFLILISLALLLVGCGNNSDSEKTVIQVKIRSNRVQAQSNATNFYTQQNLATQPTPVATATPTPLPLEIAEVEEEEQIEPVLIYRVTPTPMAVDMGRPDRIVISSADVDIAVEPVYSTQNQYGSQWFQNWATASFAAGFHESSALLGQAGNTVISGHNNIEGSVFRELYQVQPGEVIQIYANGYRFDYIVEDQFVVREAGVPMEQRLQNASWIQTTVDERVTLVSCWPPEGNSHRVIVVAKPIHDTAQASTDSGQNTP